MTSIATVFGLVVAAALTLVLCVVFRIDFRDAMRLHRRHGLVRGLGLWPTLSLVAMIALLVDREGTAWILAFICPPGRGADVQRLMPRAVGVFVGAGVFTLGAGLVLRAVLRTPAKSPRADEPEEVGEYDQ